MDRKRVQKNLADLRHNKTLTSITTYTVIAATLFITLLFSSMPQQAKVVVLAPLSILFTKRLGADRRALNEIEEEVRQLSNL